MDVSIIIANFSIKELMHNCLASISRKTKENRILENNKEV